LCFRPNRAANPSATKQSTNIFKTNATQIFNGQDRHSYTIAESKKRIENRRKNERLFFFFSVGTNEEVNFERLNGFAFVSTNDAPFHNAPGNDGKRKEKKKEKRKVKGDLNVGIE
jgi:hypothetical protein